MNEPFIYNKNSTAPRKSSPLSSLGDTLRGKGKFVTIASVFGLLMAVAITTQQVLLQQQTRSNASYTNGANLSMTTAKQTVGLNEEFDVNVMIDSPSLSITAADIQIDVPSQLQVLSITNGGFLAQTAVAPAITPKSARFIHVSGIAHEKRGSGSLAILRVRALQAGTAPLTFNTLISQVTAFGIENQNVINKLTPITIDVSSSTYASPTPGYTSPTPGYTSPTPGYASPTPGYASPTPGYASPTPGYASPTPVKITPTGNDADLPVVSFKSPANGAKLPTYGSVQFQVEAYSQSGIKEIKIYDNGTLTRTCLSATSCTLWYSPAKGTHTMVATVLSNSAKSSSTTIVVTR